MRVHGWAADRAGCWWYRLEMPLRELERRGAIEVASCEERLPTDVYTGRTEPRIIVGQRVSKPEPTSLWQQLARDGRHTLVYELDDDVLNIDAESNPLGHQFFSQREIQSYVKHNLSVADHVVVSTETLAGVVREYNESVYVLPNGIPAALLSMSDPPEWRQPKTPVVIGWQGSATHGMDWRDVANYVDKAIVREHPRALLRVWGGRTEWFDRMKCRREHARWVDDIWDYYRSLRMDVALAPLRPHLFNRSKSAIRVMEAGALGIPVIASDVGPYAEYVQHGRTGWLVRRDHEWTSCVRDLINSPITRQSMGANAREQAREHTIEGRVGDIWETFYRKVAEAK